MTSMVHMVTKIKAARTIPAIIMGIMRAMLSMVVVVVGERKQLVTLSDLIGTWYVTTVIRDIAD